jgi:hypothetical protein
MTKIELKMARLDHLIERGQDMVKKANALKEKFTLLADKVDAFVEAVKTDSENHKKQEQHKQGE